jgi:hypothetical protein
MVLQQTNYRTLGPCHPPIITVGHPIIMTPPWTVGSPILAAGRPPIMTLLEPMAMTSGGPTQNAISVTRAAGSIPIRTVGQHGGRIGPPTCGTSTVTIGQVCISVILAARGIGQCPFQSSLGWSPSIEPSYTSGLWQESGGLPSGRARLSRSFALPSRAPAAHPETTGSRAHTRRTTGGG